MIRFSGQAPLDTRTNLSGFCSGAIGATAGCAALCDFGQAALCSLGLVQAQTTFALIE